MNIVQGIAGTDRWQLLPVLIKGHASVMGEKIRALIMEKNGSFRNQFMRILICCQVILFCGTAGAPHPAVLLELRTPINVDDSK